MSPTSQSRQAFGYPGAIPTVSANGSANGIVWLLEGGFGGTLHAYDASNVARELYNSQMKVSRDSLGSFVRFTVPTVANGKVYAGTGNSLAVFGLLNQPPQPSLSAVVNSASFQPGPVAPGSLISIFGVNLATGTTSSLNSAFSTTLGGATLSINGVPAPLQFVSPTRSTRKCRLRYHQARPPRTFTCPPCQRRRFNSRSRPLPRHLWQRTQSGSHPKCGRHSECPEQSRPRWFRHRRVPHRPGCGPTARGNRCAGARQPICARCVSRHRDRRGPTGRRDFRGSQPRFGRACFR